MDRIVRPPMTILPESALVPDKNLSRTPPTHFTHEVVNKQPYYFSKPQSAEQPIGFLSVGDKLLLVSHDGGEYLHAEDARGLLLVTAFAGLKSLDDTKSKRSH
jgi:hypothetical protein